MFCANIKRSKLSQITKGGSINVGVISKDFELFKGISNKSDRNNK